MRTPEAIPEVLTQQPGGERGTDFPSSAGKAGFYLSSLFSFNTASQSRDEKEFAAQLLTTVDRENNRVNGWVRDVLCYWSRMLLHVSRFELKERKIQGLTLVL